MNLPTCPTHGPMRGRALTSGSVAGSIARSRASDCGQERLAGDVRDDARQIAEFVTAVEQAGLFLARVSVTQKLHGASKELSAISAGRVASVPDSCVAQS